MEKMGKPVCAAIDKVALGGGLEVALACHYRVAAASARVGLPEVNLGILPGAGGTQRLPRIVGGEAALELILSGTHVPAAKAHALKLVDEVAPKGTDVVQAAKALLLRELASNQPLSPRRVGLRTAAPLTQQTKAAAELKWGRKRRGQPAVKNIIAAVDASHMPLDEGLQEEARLFFELIVTREARALQHMFFAERQCTKVPGLDKRAAVDVRSVGIIGAGTMGGGIAMACAAAGISVVLLDVSEAAVQKGMAVVASNWERSVKRGSLTPERKQKMLARIKPSTSYADLAQMDMVIEAVFESLPLKKKIFAQLDRVCKPGALLCSNTSALDIDEIAEATSRPDAVCGVHFFSPANVMPLLENVRGAKSSPRTLATVMAFGSKIRKVPVMVGNCHGFVGNRMLAPYQRAAIELAEAGVPVSVIDAAIEGFGMAMGPFAMMDLAGLDIGYQERVASGVADPSRNVADAMCAAGRLGQKTQKGMYTYAGRKRSPDPEADAIIRRVAQNKGSAQLRAQPSAEEIVQRLLYPLVNEGFAILEEGIALRPSDIDVVYVHGYGWPRPKGGPMHWAEAIKLKKIVAALEQQGVTPAASLRELAASKGSVAKHFARTAPRSKL